MSPIEDSAAAGDMQRCGMRSGISVVVTASDRAHLEALVAARGTPQKHVWQARLVLLSDDGLGTVGIMAEPGKSKTCVWRWQERLMAKGVKGLLRDRTRPPGVAPLAQLQAVQRQGIRREAP